MAKKKRKLILKSLRPIGGKKYGLSLQTKPTELSEVELAVLVAMTTKLSDLENLPGFDPASVQLQLTFASGNKGVAKLEKVQT